MIQIDTYLSVHRGIGIVIAITRSICQNGTLGMIRIFGLTIHIYTSVSNTIVTMEEHIIYLPVLNVVQKHFTDLLQSEL